jgi:hypothetical protein
VLQPFQTVEGRIGLYGNQLDGGVVLAQVAPNPGQRTGGAQPGDEMRDLPAGLLDDFRAGGVVCASQLAGLSYWLA